MFRSLSTIIFLLLSIFFVACPAYANVKLPAIISDNMVLQRDKPVHLWGTADPQEMIGIRFGEQAAVATADKDGNWSAVLKPLKAGGPFEMTIHGKNEITLKNILVGEVWLATGQSNMVYEFSAADHTKEDEAKTNCPAIRLFRVNKLGTSEPTLNDQCRWDECNVETAHDFSAVGMFVAAELYQALGVPVGIIETAHSGATIDSMISRKGIDSSNEFRSMAPKSDAAYADFKSAFHKYQADLAQWQIAEPEARLAHKPMPDKPEPPEPPRMRGIYVVSGFYDAIVKPIVPFSMRGVLFYQGESDVFQSNAKYRKLFALLVQDWRTQFKDVALPLIYVQLPNVGKRAKQPGDSDWAAMREAQAFCRRIPYTYMIVAVDTGNGADVLLHNPQKKEIAHRLAAAVLATQYHTPQPYASPIYDTMEILGNKVRIRFRYADKGLISKGLPVRGFEIAGEDHKFVWADAHVDGDTVLVSSDKVEHPVAVRYGWADNPTVNLFGTDKLPVAPFRTDAWPISRVAATGNKNTIGKQ